MIEVLKRSDILWDPMPVSQVVAFYLGIPLLMALLFGLNHAGLAHHMSIVEGVPYWAGIWLPFWLMLELMTRASAFMLRPWSPPLWVILVLGAILATLVSGPYVRWWIELYMHLIPDGRATMPPRLTRESIQAVDRLLGFAGTPLFWLTVNYYYDRILEIPRYRGRILDLRQLDRQSPVPAPASAVAGSQPPSPAPRDLPNPFLDLLPDRLGKHVLALQAEDHYVRAFTLNGSALVRYRFRDAVQDMAAIDGMQVHRSFWVRRSAVRGLDIGSGPPQLVLDNNLRIPVSQAFRGAVRTAGFPAVSSQTGEATGR